MGEKRVEIVTESMFYVLMAFMQGESSGTEAAEYVKRVTSGRVLLGPATLYTILGRFESEGVITETRTEGRKRIYSLTDKGRGMYDGEVKRMKLCLNDDERRQKENA